MPAPTNLTITLQELYVQMLTLGDLSKQERAELRTAITSFAKLCGRTPADIIADPAIIRGLVATAPWMLAGYTKGSWANIRSRLTKAMQLAGIKVHRQRRNFKLNLAWEQLLASLCRRDRDELHRFAGWCSVHGIKPDDVSTATFEHFLTYLDEQMIQRNPRERAHVARRVWNRAIATSDSPHPMIPAPEPIGTQTMRWTDFPQSLRAELDAYRKRAVEADVFNDEHRAIKPITLGNYLVSLRVLLTALVEDGVSATHFTTLATIIDPATVKHGLEVRLGERKLDDKARMDLHRIVVAVLNLARYIGADEAHAAKLKALLKKVRFTARGMCEKNKQRLRPLFDPAVRNLLLNLPLRVAKEMAKVTQPTIRHAQRMQMAVLLELLIHVPLRIRNAAELDLAKDISPPIAGKIGHWRISIPADEVKNAVAIDAEIGDGLGALLNRYVSVFRPVIAKGANTNLFTSQNGGSKGPSALAKQLAAFVRREVGIIIHAHLMRHLAAHLYLLGNPGDHETVRRLLGHKSIETTVRFYEGLQTDNAYARYDALIQDLRQQPQPKAPPLPQHFSADALDMVDFL